jgi:photosystem II stability/assembly factor-like uncharacterized protein
MRIKVLILVAVILGVGCESKTILQLKWDKMSTGTAEDIFGIFFHDEDRGWAVTSDGKILGTEDGCRTWSTTDLGDFWLEDIYFADKKNGFVVGSRGSLYRTRDAGQTWVDESLDTTIWFYDIGFWDDDAGALVGAKSSEGATLVGAIFVTEDGGETWQEAYNDMHGISSLFLKRPTLGWVTSMGSVGSTTNRGENWEKNILDRNDVVRGSFFLTGQTGWIVGHNGLFASTTDGGWSWQKKGRLTDRNLYAIAFQSVYDAIAVGEDGKIFLSTNSGANWAIDSSFVKSTLRDIEVVDGQVWICGDAGTLIHVHE